MLPACAGTAFPVLFYLRYEDYVRNSTGTVKALLFVHLFFGPLETQQKS